MFQMALLLRALVIFSCNGSRHSQEQVFDEVAYFLFV